MTVPSHDARGTELLSADQLAERLGRDKRWVYRQRDRGMPALRLGRELCFQWGAVLRWLEGHRVGDWPDEERAA